LGTIAEYLFDGSKKITLSNRQFDPGNPDAGYSPKQDSFLSLRRLEKLYKNEDALLDAIQAGDTKRALQCIANFSYYHIPQRVSEKMRDAKNYLLAFNTLARKAVQNSAVHPMHIHTISTDFAQRIEAVEKTTELVPLSEAMIHRYCALVQEYSLGKFSLAVRNTINFVEFNLKESLSLSILAKQLNIDPCNLSRCFSHEMGMTLTDFINIKRLEYAKHLLAGPDMYIQEIATECGFQDMNYFCRLFKRKYGKTPKEYRNSLHA
jgi:YesN/AraC family two-component response regulator